MNEPNTDKKQGEGKAKIIIRALKKIAIGRVDNGRPLASEISRQIARDACLKAELNWRIKS